MHCRCATRVLVAHQGVVADMQSIICIMWGMWEVYGRLPCTLAPCAAILIIILLQSAQPAVSFDFICGKQAAGQPLVACIIGGWRLHNDAKAGT
jgi:hypothetical protein